MKVNFIFIGPDKSGSSWLFRILAKHPQVFMTPAKDPGYFDEHYQKGEKWYASHFDGNTGEKIIGEASHNYLFSEKAAERIAQDLPGAKLAVCLREPVDRAFSAYLYLLKHGLFKGSFEEALGKVPELKNNGCYGSHLENYLKHHSQENLLVTAFDDLQSDPQVFLDEYTNFLKINRYELEETQKSKSLPAGKSRSLVVSFALKKVAMLMRTLGLVTLVGKLKSWPTLERTLYKPFAENEKPKPSPETVKKLQDFFRPEIQKVDQTFSSDYLKRWDY